MNKSELIEAFSSLGDALLAIPDSTIDKANQANPWFTPQFIRLAASNWQKALQKEKIQRWLENESFELSDKQVGIIMAGNIPFVGLHDLLSVLASGKKATIKLSSTDDVLMKFAIDCLIEVLPALKNRMVTEAQLNNIDFLIATGSNNSSRYFEYYFKNKPLLIRRNRTSVAILNGLESDAELELLADDIFTYFGLGCRNVTHLLLPRNFELKRIYEAYDKYMDHVHHHKYYNNYMYHKSILLMNLDKHYDNGFMLFQEKKEVHAPIATLNYHYYDTVEDVESYINENPAQWQCIVSKMDGMNNTIPFGETQNPELWNYADDVNTLEFLKNKTL